MEKITQENMNEIMVQGNINPISRMYPEQVEKVKRIVRTFN